MTNVIEQERIVTTRQGKAVKPLVDKMITLAKRDTLHTRRQAAAFLGRRTPSRSCSISWEPASASATAATPDRGWAGAKAMAPSRSCSNWSVPNW